MCVCLYALCNTTVKKEINITYIWQRKISDVKNKTVSPLNCHSAKRIPNFLAKCYRNQRMTFHLLWLFADWSLKTTNTKWGVLFHWLVAFFFFPDNFSEKFYLLAVVYDGHIQYWQVCDTSCERGVCSWCIYIPGDLGPIFGRCRWHNELSRIRNQQNQSTSQTKQQNLFSHIFINKNDRRSEFSAELATVPRASISSLRTNRQIQYRGAQKL